MLLGAFTFVTSADEVQYTYNTSSAQPTISYLDGTSMTLNDKSEYVSSGERVIYTKEDKLATMDLRFSRDGYELYVDAYSGEVATRCIATGEILFTNPYNIADSTATDSVKSELMSQLVVKFVDVTESGSSEQVYTSYEWAATRGQIVVRNIKNGIRVEYTIGREEARKLVPRMIEKTAYETKIYNVLSAAIEGADDLSKLNFGKMPIWYRLKAPSAETSEALREEMYKSYPITKKMDIYVLDTTVSDVEMTKIENLIKTYCPDYTYEELDEDHARVEYELDEKNPPLFKMALEYSIDASGLSVRLPANGIRFNEALYQLNSIEILPYMGAGASSNASGSAFENNSGYNFFPDGSGSLFDFNKITDIGVEATIMGKVYGQDYAYHTVSGKYQEIIRYPVFGTVKTEDEGLLEWQRALDDKKAELTAAGVEDVTDEMAAAELDESLYLGKEKTSGFVAIVEEGDALMELSTYHAVLRSEYNSMKMTVYPRPQDTYNVADAISVGQNDTWTVVSSRKYTGNYKVRYIMLTDSTEGAGYYDCSYTGMAKAYREYLESKNILTRLSENDVEKDIPLYIETFGALMTTERFLSIPVNVMTPLTTYADVKTMYDELSGKGIGNINFILTGYTDGGMTGAQVPYKLKWEKAAEEGGMDFEDLLADAKTKGYGIYPNFDFAYAQSNGLFDGLTLGDHAVKTIDDRYTTKREYSATKQTYVSYFDIAISPAYFSHFYNKLTEKYLEYAPMGIAVSTLGSALNSDFDEDDPYNREDSKGFTVKALKYFDEAFKDGKVLTSGGNAYTWQYVDYITDVALDSSRYSYASASVPFLGMVLHGYREITGTPINMEGNIEYAVLKAIESGASLKFILSYRNTNNLKNYEDLSEYYSVRYDIWVDDIQEIYNELNSVLAGVQTSTITDHKFVNGIRVPDDDEIVADAMNAIDKAIEDSAAYKSAVEEAQEDAYREARLEIEKILANVNAAVAGQTCAKLEANLETAIAKIDLAALRAEYDTAVSNLAAMKTALDAIENKESDKYNTELEKFNTAKDEYLALIADVTRNLATVNRTAAALLDKVVELKSSMALADGKYRELINADPTLTETQRADIIAKIDAIVAADILVPETIEQKIAAVNTRVNGVFADVLAFVAGYEGAAGNDVFETGELQALLGTAAVYEYAVATDEIIKEPGKVEIKPYSSDDNKIVYEEYENGTAFLLNFNNYTVKVVVNNVSYLLDAYGYVVLN